MRHFPCLFRFDQHLNQDKFINIPMEGHEAMVTKLVFNPFKGSAQLASASLDGTVRITDSFIDTSYDLILTENKRDVRSLAFKNDKEIVMGENHSLKLWITNHYQLIQELDKLIDENSKN